MIRIFKAKDPSKYVQIQRNFTMSPEATHAMKSSVTDYKLHINVDSRRYNSFIKENGGKWQPYSISNVADMDAFWDEVADGHLIENTQEHKPSEDEIERARRMA